MRQDSHFPFHPGTIGSKEQLALQHPLFHGIQPEMLRPFLNSIQERTAIRGSVVHAPGTVSTPLCLVLSGGLVTYQITPEGRKLVLELIEAGGVDGLLPMVGESGHFTEAATTTRMLCIPWPVLEQLIQAEPNILRNLMSITLRRLQRREDHLQTMATVNRTQRLARLLWTLARTAQDGMAGRIVTLRRRPTHQLLAEMVGVRRETVTVHLSRLVRLGAVQIGRRDLTVNRIKLREVMLKPPAAES